MRINRGALLKIARDTVDRRTRKDHTILSAYLCGSVLGDDCVFGGAADIDLTFIHTGEVAEAREIVRLTDEVHLDIAHYEQKEFRQPRALRLHPWLGPTIFTCQILFDPQHFMDFTQASVRGQFFRADYVLGRARQQADHAREIWFGFYSAPPEEVSPEEIARYLRAIEHAANAVASLNGPPLTERRFLLRFPERAEAVGHPGLYPGLLGMLGAPNVSLEHLSSWLDDWQAALQAIPSQHSPARLHVHRIPYYRKALEYILHSGQPQAVLWPLLRTWTAARSLLPAVEAEAPDGWLEACRVLGLSSEKFHERIQALDSFLDLVDDVLDEWARANGVTIS